jgi:hypothetical protein
VPEQELDRFGIDALLVAIRVKVNLHWGGPMFHLERLIGNLVSDDIEFHSPVGCQYWMHM